MHNPTPEQILACERVDNERRMSCARILEKHRLKLEAERMAKLNKNSLLIKTKKK